MQIKNKVAVVTGAAQGIGKAISEAILQKEGKVVLSDINGDVGQETCKTFKTKYGDDFVTFFKCDVTKKSEQQELFQYAVEKFGSIDIACNNAGIVLEETLENFDKVIDINLNGVIIGCMVAMEHMKKLGGGVIINTSSGVDGISGMSLESISEGSLEAFPVVSAYSATKYGIVGYTKSMAVTKDTIESNIRLNCICPWLVRTDMGKFPEGKPEVQNAAKKYGLIEASYVGKGVVQLIEDDTKNGVALKISEPYGFEFL